MERVGSEHEAALTTFFVREWGGSSTDGPSQHVGFDASIPQWVCLRNDEAIGYLGTIPVDLRLAGRPIEASWLKGFWVSEPYRSGPIGPMLLERAVSELDVVGSQIVDPAARRVLESHGFTHRCTLFNRVLLLHPRRVLSRIDLDRIGLGLPAVIRLLVKSLQKAGIMGLLGGLGSIGLAAPRLIDDGRARGLSVRYGWDVSPSDMDALWEELRDQVHTTPDRSAASITERYPAASHDLATIWSGNRLRGWVVIRRPGPQGDLRLSGVRVASVADIFFPVDEDSVGRKALHAAERLGRSNGGDALLCSGSHPALDRRTAARGYLTVPGTVLIMARDGRDHSFATGAENIWVTRGDARSDETF